MKNFLTRLQCFIIGWDFKILQSCTESSRKQLKKYSAAILILMLLWAFVGFSFADRYTTAPIWGCIIASFIFVVIILCIERQIILTVGKSWGMGIFRILIAFLMAVIGSAIIDQIIFKDDIGKKMIEIVDRQVNEQLPQRLIVNNTKLQELQSEIDSLNKKTLELNYDISITPEIISVSTVTNPITLRKSDGADSIVYRTSTSRTPIPNPKIKEVEANNSLLDRLRNQQEDLTQMKIDAESLLREELKSKQGFLEELEAIYSIVSENRIAFVFYGVIFLFLMFLELFVVISKLGDTKCDYDIIIEYQLQQKIKSLNELVK